MGEFTVRTREVPPAPAPGSPLGSSGDPELDLERALAAGPPPPPAAVVVSVSGELDVATADQVGVTGRAALARARRGGGLVVLDLSGATFLDSTGFRALATLAQDGRGAGLSVRVVSPPQVRAVRRVVDVLGLRVVAPVDDDLAAALDGDHDVDHDGGHDVDAPTAPSRGRA